MKRSTRCLRRRGRALPAPVILALLAACGGADAVSAPDEGTLLVTTATGGDAVDPDGYRVSLDGAAGIPIGVAAQLSLAHVPSGEHRVRLDGIAPNCTLDGSNPRDASIAPGATLQVAFGLRCTDAGDLRVRTQTNGPSPDDDGYGLSIDGGPEQPIGTLAERLLRDLEPGEHNVALSGLADNCAVNGPNPVPFTVLPYTPAEVAFDVLCSGLTVTTATGGADPDLDGYLLSVDGGASQPLGVNTRLELPVREGDHLLALRGVADNCTPTGENPRHVAILPGVRSETTFQVLCRVRIGGPAQLLYWGGPAGHIYRRSGSSTIDLTPHSDGTRGRWSPDRSKIVFESRRNGEPEIFVMNPDGSAPTRIARGRAPAWSADGTRIAFVRPGIATMKPDGSDVRLLTSDNSDDQPVWSPDGTRIAFERRGTCRLFFFDLVCATDLYTSAPDGSQVTDLTGLPAGDRATDPAWSPDGTRLAYAYGVFLTLPRNLFILNLAGGIRQLTNIADRWEQSPVWSPDGAEIAFADSDGEGIARLVTIPATGGSPVAIPTRARPVYPSSWR